MATTWSISRRSGTCAASGRAFEDGERHVSLLQVEEGTLARVDLSMDAWRAQAAELRAGPEDGGPLLYWFTRHEVEKKKTVQLDLDSLDRLFLQLEGRAEREVRELRYVLCLLLMRKRRVKVERVVRKDGEESFLVKRPKDDQRYTVYVYDFEPEQLDALRAQLQAVFDGAEGPHGVRLLGEDDELEEGPDAEGPDAELPDVESPEAEAQSETSEGEEPQSEEPEAGEPAPELDEGDAGDDAELDEYEEVDDDDD